MKPELFTYVQPETVEETLFLMEELADTYQLLAGGQSLVPTMALRMAAPEVLIDISRVSELQDISSDNGVLRIGAGANYADILASNLVAKACPLLTKAIPAIAHQAIRNRGTIGGSLAHADPASELPACMIALNATVILQTKHTTRHVPAETFFLGTYLTALAEGEMIVAVEIPVIVAGEKHLFHEFTRRSGDYAMLGAAFVIKVDTGTGTVSDARLAYFSISDRPLLAKTAATFLVGQVLSADAIESCANQASEELDCLGDLYNSAAMKRHLVRVLTTRVLGELGEGDS